MADLDFKYELISRKEAKAKGHKHYFTGEPCKYGHIALRAVLKSTCLICQRNRSRIWLRENRDNFNLKRRQRYKLNPDRRRQQGKEWEDAHREEKRTRERQRYQANLEAERARTKRKKLQQPEKYAEYRRNRYARKKAAQGTHSADEIRDVLEKQFGRCAICRVNVRRKYHVDHVVPIARGGSNSRRNIQILCPTCNLTKNARDPIEFMQSRGFLL